MTNGGHSQLAELLTEEGEEHPVLCFKRDTWKAPIPSATVVLNKAALGGFEAQLGGFVKKTGGFDPKSHSADLGKKLADLETNSVDLESNLPYLRTNSADLRQTHSNDSEEESAASVK